MGTDDRSINPSAFLAKRKTQHYKGPSVYGGRLAGAFLDGKPIFHAPSHVPRMLTDPMVRWALLILRTPLYGVTWKVQADDARAEKFIDAQARKIWAHVVPKLRAHTWGWDAGEITYKLEGRRIVFDRYDPVHPLDAKPLVFDGGRKDGQLAGVRIPVKGCNEAAGRADLRAPNGFWFSGEAEFGSLYGRPRTEGMYEPWLEKRGRNGAVDARRLWFRKNAYRGGILRHPLGSTDFGDETTGPILKSNQDVAREIVEKFETGGVLALPNVMHADERMSGKYAWEWTDPASFGDVKGLLDYSPQLDKEILQGANIPPELVEASLVGSGYNGRAIPAQVFFTSCDEFAELLMGTIDRQALRHLVRVNFGRCRYELKLNSLAAMIARDSSDAGQAAGQGRAGDQGGGSGGVQLSHGPRDRGGDRRQQPQRQQPPERPRLSDRVRALAEQDYPDLGPVQLGWSAAQSRTGKVKAVGTDEHTGQTLYGKRAERALAAQAKGQDSEAGNESADGKAAAGQPAKAAKGKAKAAKAKGERPTVEATVAHVQALRTKFTISRLSQLADYLQDHTVAELNQVKQQLGIKASGPKAELARKIAQLALADAEGEKPPETEAKAEPKAKAAKGAKLKAGKPAKAEPAKAAPPEERESFELDDVADEPQAKPAAGGNRPLIPPEHAAADRKIAQVANHGGDDALQHTGIDKSAAEMYESMKLQLDSNHIDLGQIVEMAYKANAGAFHDKAAFAAASHLAAEALGRLTDEQVQQVVKGPASAYVTRHPDGSLSYRPELDHTNPALATFLRQRAGAKPAGAPESKPAAPAVPEKPDASAAMAPAPAGSEVVAEDPARGLRVTRDKEGLRTTQLDPEHGRRMVQELRPAIEHALRDGRLFKEGREGLIPLDLFARLVRDKAPNATTGDIYSALSVLSKERHLQLHGLNESHTLKTKGGVDGDKNPDTATLWARGKALHYVALGDGKTPATVGEGITPTASEVAGPAKVAKLLDTSKAEAHKVSTPEAARKAIADADALVPELHKLSRDELAEALEKHGAYVGKGQSKEALVKKVHSLLTAAARGVLETQI